MDKDMVLSPLGYRPRSRVHVVEPELFVDTKLLAPAGVPIAIRQSMPPSDANWISHATWKNNTGYAITLFQTTWEVPPAPSSAAEQLIFLFNGMSPEDNSFIVQPVLQWGPSGMDMDDNERTGQFWTIASWIVGPQAVYTNHIEVKPGQELVGVIALTNVGGQYSYTCQFENFPETKISLPWYPTSPLVNCYVALEAYEYVVRPPHPTPPYDLRDGSEYPDTGMTDFRAINIDPADPDGTWDPTNGPSNAFGERVEIVTNSAKGGEINIHYR